MLNARKLLSLSEEQLWTMPEGYYDIEFDDGIVEHVFYKDIINSVLLWNMLKHFNKYPLLKEYLHTQTFTSKSILSIINDIKNNIIDQSEETVCREELMEQTMNTVSNWYNTIVRRCSRFLKPLSILDVVDIMRHPRIAKANAEVQPNPYSVAKCYEELDAVLGDPNELPGNAGTLGVQCGTQKIAQIRQCFGPRGEVTDINERINPVVITKGFAEGIWTLAESMAESRSGTKSLGYNQELLKATEYFNRMMQLIMQNIQNLHDADCGTTLTNPILITDKMLKIMKGKYYVDPSNGVLKWFRGNEKHLVNKTVQVRTIFGCMHPDPVGICSKCYGRMSWSIPYRSNIGHVSAVHVGDKITSIVLSTKHTDTTKMDVFKLFATEQKYLMQKETDGLLFLKPELNKYKVKLMLSKAACPNIADVLMLENLSEYPITNATVIDKLWIAVETDEGTVSDQLGVSIYNRKASLSNAMLQHLRAAQWEETAKGDILIDLTGFDRSQPILELPSVQITMFYVMQRIQSFMHSGDGKGAGKDKDPKSVATHLINCTDPIQGVLLLQALINEKLHVNFAHCEIMVMSMMIRSAVNADYRLPKPAINGVFERYSRIMPNNSLAAAMAFELQHEAFLNANSYSHQSRNPHPYDDLVISKVA